MSKNLFNEKTIIKNIEQIEPTAKQKTTSKKWIELLEKNQLQEEVANYPKFMIYILKDLLGYDITDFKHEEKNMEFPFRDKSGDFLVCFEAKGTKTKDLWALQGRNIKIRETPVNQINDYIYKNKIPYGILTNYRDFVLFKREEGYTKYHKINFLDIKKNPDKLKEFIFIFSKESFEKEDTTKLYNDSIIEERNLTKEFYKLYHETRLMILKEFKESEIENEICLHYTQLFLNRLMFIFFAEDTELLDKRYFEIKILEVLEKSGGIDGHTHYIFGKIKGIFRELDKEIPKQIKGFNGELFKEEIDGRLSFKDYRNKLFFKDVFQNYRLDKKVQLNEYDKKIFNKHKNRLNKIIENILLMASFDFKSEVNVNILGHIFEKSISDIENLKEEKISKRKQEGVFYTPEYVTEYICRNTIIPYLSKSGINDVNELIDEYSRDIEELEKKFRSIKILDSACGSGAFLIKATEILFEIFEKIQFVKENYGDYKASRGLKIKSNIKGQLTFKKWDEKEEIINIIENNIFGVDINEESVEITKLSLFLKIARKNKKLIDLSNNIKQGNSLVSDEKIEENLAFDWNKNFPEIMSNGGFDIVIGNPPYVFTREVEFNDKFKEYIAKNYLNAKDSISKSHARQSGKINLYSLFLIKSKDLLKNGGFISFIIPNNLLRTTTYDIVRKQLLDNFEISKIVDMGTGVFEGVTASTIIIKMRKNNSEEKRNKNLVEIIPNFDNQKKKNKISQIDFLKNTSYAFNIVSSKSDRKLLDKITEDCENMGDITIIHAGGIATGKNKKEMIEDYKKSEKHKPMLEGKDIKPFFPVFSERYILYEKKLLYRAREESIFLSPEKLITQRISGGLKPLVTSYDNEKYYTFNSTNTILPKGEEYSLKYVLALLNSRLINWYYVSKFTNKSNLTVNISKTFLEKIPIKKISLEKQKPLIEKADLMVDKNKEFYEKKDKFIKLIKYKYNLDKISRKLNTFYNLNFKEFVNEIKNKNKVMSIEKEAELMNFFEKNKKEVLELINEISKTENEIDKMVYKLYGLTDKEIEVIEKS
ncbi:N-6 DNA methylase [Candidatus Pacearchaeota archaeon]|nr:N-6 DNA methylase [Candidatus Pacearchaeota archaeon]